MKRKLIKSITLISALTVGAIASNNTESITLLKKVEALPMVKAHKYKPEKIKDIGDLYLVKGNFKIPAVGGRPAMNKFAVMYLTKNLKTAVYGQGFDTQTSQSYKPFSVDKIKANAGLVYGSGTDEYILVVDPLCPVCMEFDKTLPKYEKEVKMYFVFLPLKRLHPTAPQAIRYILSQKTNAEKIQAMQKISHGDKEYLNHKDFSNTIDKQMALHERYSNELGATGTPSLYRSNGEAVNRGILEYIHQRNLNEQKTTTAPIKK